MTPCANCGSSIELVESDPYDVERFTEKYECVGCSAEGEITGITTAPPTEWRRSGTVFDGGVV